MCTEIQAAAIPHALAGRDVLGAAKTGSGKTLSFIIPIFERLHTERWGREDGLAVIIISPTRDMNILVATPGRLLQHFEQTAAFDASQLLMLVLDEADRILDMGFKEQLDGILNYLPPQRQTLLFSATQTKSVRDLARLSLRDPQYVAVHEGGQGKDAEVIPSQLVQRYVTVRLPEKLDVLFSFLKAHLKSKIMVFFSTCSQVRFVYECFCGMQPGIPITCLHGKVKQEKRQLIYADYTRRKSACMLATDIAARGLDFPTVDWVIQVDAPEDVDTYVHRVGRTARHNAEGRSLMLVLPSEEKQMLAQLNERGIEPKKLTVNPKRAFSVSAQASALLASAPEYRQLAKKAFTGYLRSLQMLPDKSRVVNITKLPLDDFASSLGLGFTPTVPIINEAAGTDARVVNREVKNKNRKLDKLKQQIKEAKMIKKINSMLSAKGIDPESEEGEFGDDAVDSDSENELFEVKTKGANDEDAVVDEDIDAPSIFQGYAAEDGTARASVLSAGGQKRKLRFDENGEPENGEPLQLLVKEKSGVNDEEDSESDAKQVDSNAIAEHMRRVKQKVDEGRAADTAREKQRVREKHMAIKADKESDNQDIVGENENDNNDSDASDSSSGSQSSSNDSAYEKIKPLSTGGFNKFEADDDGEGSDDSEGFSSDSDADPEQLEKTALRMIG
eukprot:GSChrysophyteH1.ASY1.ANO1.799.1 assembled CDS